MADTEQPVVEQTTEQPTGDAPQQQDGGDRRRGGFGRGGDRRRNDGGRRRQRRPDKNAWVPVTKLGRLVQAEKIRSLEEIYLYSLVVKEAEIIDYFMKDKLKDDVMSIKPVQKQTTAGQRTRFKAFVAVGDENGHLGLGVKCSSEVATSIRGAITLAKLSLIPVRRGYWGGRVGEPHTVPCKVTGKCGSVSVRLIPAPRGTGLVASPSTRKLLTFAGISDCYSSSTGHTRTTGNLLKACFYALRSTYSYLSPDLWPESKPGVSPIQEFSEFLEKGKNGSSNNNFKGEGKKY